MRIDREVMRRRYEYTFMICCDMCAHNNLQQPFLQVVLVSEWSSPYFVSCELCYALHENVESKENEIRENRKFIIFPSSCYDRHIISPYA